MRSMGIAAIAVAGFVAPFAQAANISVTIENVGPSDGLSFTPFWIAAHNGGFDSYDGGSTLAGFPGTEELAELGLTGPISDAFAASAAGLAGGVDTTVLNGVGAPVFSGGESTTISLDVGDSSVNRYFSYASMVVPTNDLFVANGNPFAHEIFDAAGNFNGPLVIEIFASEVNDAGTEVNNADDGAAFLAGTDGAAGTVEDNVVRNLFTVSGDDVYLQSLIGRETADGNTVGSVFGSGDLIARITIVPAPGATALVGIGLVGGLRRRSR